MWKILSIKLEKHILRIWCSCFSFLLVECIWLWTHWKQKRKKTQTYFPPLRASFIIMWEVALRRWPEHSQGPTRGIYGCLSSYKMNEVQSPDLGKDELVTVWPCSPVFCHFRSSAHKSSISVLAPLSGKSLFPLNHFHSVFLLCVGGVSTKDFTSSLSFPLLPVFSPCHSSSPTSMSLHCLCRQVPHLFILCHNYFPTGLSS